MPESTEMGCCSCFGFLRKRRICNKFGDPHGHPSQENLLNDGIDEVESGCYCGDGPDFPNDSFNGNVRIPKHLQEILLSRLVCREVPVKETSRVILSEDESGHKMVNEYVHERKIGTGSYSKVVLYRSSSDGKQYALKVFHKDYLKKIRVAPSETAMTDVLREVSIMKLLDHPSLVHLFEVIDNPNTEKFYMVLEYLPGRIDCVDSGLPETTCRRYLRDIVAGLIYLHSHNVIHLDIKPDNLLVSSDGKVKIIDFGVSQVFEADNDTLRRSPGTPAFTAPECCSGLPYNGRAADTWAVGVTLYCMVFGDYPFLGESIQDIYDKIVHSPLRIPGGTNPQLADLLRQLLCKDPVKRISLHGVAEHPWVIADEGPIPEYRCLCGLSPRIPQYPASGDVQ